MGWSLITGACSGIGLEIAREAAKRGYSLVMVSNRAAELEQAADRLSSDHGIVAHAIVLDLAQPTAARHLHDRVQEFGVEIDILVNNAGVLLFGEVVDTEPERVDALLQLHVTTPSLLACYFGAPMKARQRGHILFVSSASTWSDFPGIALYGSTKRYLRSFAASMREELSPWGVNVTCVAPGAVATGLYDRFYGPAKKAARLGTFADPSYVARVALKGMFRGRALVLPGFGAKLMALAARVTPRWLIRMVRRHTDYLPRPTGS